MTLGRNTIMSLSWRYAASESAKKAVARGSCFVARKSSPSFRMGCGQISQRAALWDGPYEPQTHSPRATSHELRTTKKHWNFPVLFYKNQRLPILPGGLPPSTFGVCGLNCCVRHGNRWIPAAIATELYCSGCSYPDNCIKMFFLNGSPTWRPLPFGRILCLSQVLGLLVPVRSVHRCTSTPGLSTTSSLWDLTC